MGLLTHCPLGWINFPRKSRVSFKYKSTDGTPILRILLISSQSGRMVKYFLNWISNCGFLSFTSTVTILNIRASIVAVAEPATPQWNTHTNNRFRIIFRIFEITEISIGKRLFCHSKCVEIYSNTSRN